VDRPSIPPEQLLRAQLLRMLYLVRSEWLLMEEMDYNILFRWFVGLNLERQNKTTLDYYRPSHGRT
jgi:transposase